MWNVEFMAFAKSIFHLYDNFFRYFKFDQGFATNHFHYYFNLLNYFRAQYYKSIWEYCLQCMVQID